MIVFQDVRVHGAGFLDHLQRMQVEPAEQCAVVFHVRVAGGQQLLAVEDRIGAGEEAQRLHRVVHLLAAGRQPHHRGRHQQPCDRDGAHELERIQRLGAVERGAFDLHQLVDRHRLRMLGQRGQGLQQAGALVARFAHADDAAATGLHAGMAHVLQRVEPVLVLAGVDHLAVDLRRGVEVVVVVVEPGGLQRVGLRSTQHAQRGAGFQTEAFHRAHDLGHFHHIAILRAAPGRAHAEAAGAGILRRLRTLQHCFHAHQFLRLYAGVVARRLRAIRAVFRAATGLDRQQGGHLYRIRIVVLAMHRVRAMQQLVERQREQRDHFGAGPVVADGGVDHGTATPIHESRKCGSRPGECQPNVLDDWLTRAWSWLSRYHRAIKANETGSDAA